MDWAERQWHLLARLSLCPGLAHSGIPQPQPIFQEGFVTPCCEPIKFMTRLVAAHLLIPVIFKALFSEGLGHLLPRPVLSHILLRQLRSPPFSCVHTHIERDLVEPEPEPASWELPASPRPFKVLCIAGCVSKEAFSSAFFLRRKLVGMP